MKLQPIHPSELKLFVGPDTDPYEQGEYIFRVLEDREVPLCPSHERIIRCCDCKNHLYRIGGFCLRWCEETPGHWYCSEAEPKEEE